jgi:hypothetical protein
MSTVKDLKDILRLAKQTTPTCAPYSKLKKGELEARVRALNLPTTSSVVVKSQVQKLDREKAVKRQMAADETVSVLQREKASKDVETELVRIMNKMRYSIVKDQELNLVRKFLNDGRNKKKPIYKDLQKAIKDY